MFKTIDGNDIHYTDKNSEYKNVIVLLHGWGQNKEMMAPLANEFEDIRVICVDLPGFGSSTKNKSLISVYDYSLMLNKFLTKLNVNDPVVIGHSFGGKVALTYASMFSVSKLIVLASPFKASRVSSFKKFLIFIKDKLNLKFLANVYTKLFGSTDYKNANEDLKEVLKSSVSTDISDEVKKIKVPTLIFWGDKDEAINIDHGYELESLINDSALIKLDFGDHYAYLNRKYNIPNIIKEFLR